MASLVAAPEPEVGPADLLAHQVYRSLRSEVLRGAIRPNERLIESDVSTRLNTSRTPLREALQRLAADGLIERVRRGWRVREFALTEILEVYEARAALEGYAARLACERATAADREAILGVHDQLGKLHKVMTPGDPLDDLIAMNERFHTLINEAAHNSRLERLIEHNQSYYFNIRTASLYSLSELEETYADHIRIVDALLERDGDLAEGVTRRHIMDSALVIKQRMT
ncbi:MAG: GntR family transcriptional regulator [Ilumatobacteraceae bacterium]